MPKPSMRSPSLTSQESYTAVILADLVADVPISPDNEECELPRRNSAPKSPKRPRPEKHGFDGPLAEEPERSPTPAVDTTESKDEKKQNNEKSLSKSMILNAAPLVDSKIDIEMQNISAQKKLGQAQRSKPTVVSQPEVTPEMSPLRKVAFAVSFLPSVMFVLCIAIIVPCKIKLPHEPSVYERWSLTLNQTDVTSHFATPRSLFLTINNVTDSFIQSLEQKTGKEFWKTGIRSPTRYMDCENFDSDNDGNVDCIVLDQEGNLYVFNTSNGEILWEINVANEDEIPSLPVFLQNSNEESFTIALAVSNMEIRFIAPGKQFKSLKFDGCTSVPSQLTLWVHDLQKDFVFNCNTSKENAAIIRIPQNMWSNYGYQNISGTMTLVSGDSGDLKDSLFLPTNDGLVVWIKDSLSLMQPDGNIAWSVHTRNHSEEKRYLKYGNFVKDEMQIMLFSSGANENLTIEALSPINGNSSLFISRPKMALLDTFVLKVNSTDLIFLALQKKVDLSPEILAHTTIISFLSENDTEEITKLGFNANAKISQEIVFLNLTEVKEFRILYEEEMRLLDGLYKSAIEANLDTQEAKTNITINIINKYQTSEYFEITTTLKNLVIEDWETSVKKSSACEL